MLSIRVEETGCVLIGKVFWIASDRVIGGYERLICVVLYPKHAQPDKRQDENAENIDGNYNRTAIIMGEIGSLYFLDHLEAMPVKNKQLALGVLVLFLLLLFYVSSSLASPRSDDLEVSFINVGQGDSILIRDPGGFDVLIDGGRSPAGPTVVAYLHQQGVDSIDVMLASHADSDHIGGLIDVLDATDISVKAVLYNGYAGDTTPWARFATAVANDGLGLIPAEFPITYTWGTTKAYILNPVAGLVNPTQNPASVVVLLEYGQMRFLFTGDIDSTVEASLVARGTPIPAQILKVAHHGSGDSSSNPFLSAVKPEQAIISVGLNSYGHPSNLTLAQLQAIGAKIWRTDYRGTILVTSDGVVYHIRGIFPGNIIFMPALLRQNQSSGPTPVP